MNEGDILLARVIVANNDASSPGIAPLKQKPYSAEEKKKNFR